MRRCWENLCALLLGLALLPGAANAQDRDGDGLPDEIEVKLGTGPDRSEGLQLLIDDRARGVGDTTIRADGKAPDIDKVFFAHAGGDRYVWKITFPRRLPRDGHHPAPLCRSRRRPHDRPPGHGVGARRGRDAQLRGCQERPAYLEPCRARLAGNPVRAIVQATLSTFAMTSRCAWWRKNPIRMHILSHLRNPATDSDTTEWIMGYRSIQTDSS